MRSAIRIGFILASLGLLFGCHARDDLKTQQSAQGITSWVRVSPVQPKPEPEVNQLIARIEQRVEELYQLFLKAKDRKREESRAGPVSPDLEKKLANLEAKREGLLRKKGEFDWLLTEIENKLGKEIRKEVFPGKTTINYPPFCGQVVSGDPRRGMTTINLGWRRGVRAGMKFLAIRKDTSECRFEKVHDRGKAPEAGDPVLCRLLLPVLPIEPGKTFVRFLGSWGAENPETYIKRSMAEVEEAKKKTFRILVRGAWLDRRGFENLDADVKALEKQIKDLQAILSKTLGVLFPPRRPYWGDDKVPKIVGRVAGVSNKVNLVVISVGEEDGVRVGFEFTVYRGNEYVGKLIAEKVYPRQSACRVLKDMTKKKIKEGDRVSTHVY
jgi:hypothetical protein